MVFCNRIIGLKKVTVFLLGSHLNDRNSVLIAKIHAWLFAYGCLNGNGSLIKDLSYIRKQNNSQILTTEAANVGVTGNSCFHLPAD